MKKNLLSFLLLAFLCAVGLQVSAQTYSGTCGDNVNWSLDAETGVLEISGSGAITSAGWHEYASSISSVVIAEGVTSVPAKLFEHSETITAVSIPTTVESIGIGAFSCAVIENMTVAEGNAVYDSRENCNAIIETATNKLISGCKNTVIPNSVESIGDEAFYWCEVLTSLEIPSSVTAIGNSAFAACSTLVELALPEGLTEISRQLFDDCVSLKRVVVPSTVTSIGSFAFDNCGSLNGVVMLPSEAPELGSSSFRGCSSSLVLYYNNDSEGYESIANSCGIKALNVADNTYYFDESDGLPGASADNSFVWESPLMEYPEPINAIRLTFFKSGEKSGSYYVYSMAELELFDGEGEKIEYTAADVTTNSLDFRDGSSLEALCDGDAETYYHSKWMGSSNNFDPGDEFVYLEIALPEPVSSFKFKHTARGGNRSRQLPAYLCVNAAGFKGVPPVSGSIEGVTWSFDEETGTLTFEGDGVLNSSDYNIWYRKVNKVVVGEGITSIGSYAFDDCVGLTSIELPAGLTSIGSDAFYNCNRLTNITIPNSVTSIGTGAFRSCNALESIVVAEGNAVYDSRESCNAIIETATNALIAGCKNSTVPESITSIGSYAFYNCVGLTSIELPAGLTSIGSHAFDDCDGLTSIELPAGLTSIGSSAFYNCDGLTSIELPAGLTSIGSYAFCICDALQTVVLNCIVAPELGIYAFKYISSSAVLRYPACCDYTAWEEFFASTEAVGTVQEGTCGENLTWHFNEDIGLLRISGTGVMYDYDNESSPQPWRTLGVNTVLMDEGVENIGNYAFYNCTALTRIEIPEGVASIGDYSFYNCSSLTSIEIPNSVTSIGRYAFYDCTGLKEVYISDLASWCRIDFRDAGYATANPLFYAHNLYLNGKLITELVIPDEITEIKPFTFGGAGITSVTIHENVTEIGQDAFKRCAALSNVVIPDGVTIIGKGAFYECTGLEGVTVGAGVTRVDEGAFGRCDKLNAVYISDLAAWCGIAFYSYPNFSSNPLSNAGNLYLNDELLTELVIPENITDIKQGTFYGSTAIESITLHEHVSTIGEKAFYGCSAVECITSCIPAESLFVLGDNVMTGINLFECLLFVPYATSSTYSSTAGWMDFENIVEMEPTEITVKVNQYGSGTFCSEYDLDFTAVEGLKAYVVNGYNISNQMVTLQRVKTVKAGVGLFIKGEPGEYTVPVIERSDDNYMNMLVGTLEVTTVNSVSDDGMYYNYKYTILSGDTSPSFYRFGDGNRYSANKAYLQIPAAWLSSSSTSIGVRFDDGETTGVDDVVEEFDGGTAVYYDLNGRVVLNPTNGIYIVNGKKVIVNDK